MPTFSIPIALILVPYAAFVIFFMVQSAFTWYHLDRFGVMHGHLQAMRLVFALGSLLLLAASLLALSRYDWTASVSPSDLAASTRSIVSPL